MIKLIVDNLLVEDENGNQASFDLDAFEQEIARAMKLANVRTPWLASHLSMLVEEQIRLANSLGRSLDNDHIQKMAEKVLRSAGFDDVADALLNVSLGEAYYSRAGESGIPGQCGVREEGALFSDGASDAGSKVAETEQIRPLLKSGADISYISSDSWLDSMRPSVRTFVESGILIPVSASDIFPNARIKCYFAKMGISFESAEDLSVLIENDARIQEAFAAAVEMLFTMRQRIQTVWPGRAPAELTLAFPEINALLKTLPVRRRKDAANLLQASLAASLAAVQDQIICRF